MTVVTGVIGGTTGVTGVVGGTTGVTGVSSTGEESAGITGDVGKVVLQRFCCSHARILNLLL